MPVRQIDPARLEGEELRRWYQRTPDEIEQERQAVYDQRYNAFYGERPTPVGSGQARVAGAVAPRAEVSPARYNDPGAHPPSDLAELRRQQAEFEKTRRGISRENSWMAGVALAPAVAALGLETGAAVGARFAPKFIARGPLVFSELEPWQSGGQRIGQALTREAKAALRESGRAKYARANGTSAAEMRAQVHHSDPLEFAHLKPNADPNRLANLWALRREAHDIASREWTAFRNALQGKVPSQAELLQAKLRIDRLVEPYIVRPGVPRSNRPPSKGGPR